MTPHDKFNPIVYYSLTFLATFALWFGGAYASCGDDGSGLFLVLIFETVIGGFVDQAALHGVLSRICDLEVEAFSVQCMKEGVSGKFR